MTSFFGSSADIEGASSPAYVKSKLLTRAEAEASASFRASVERQNAANFERFSRLTSTESRLLNIELAQSANFVDSIKTRDRDLFLAF